VISNLNFRADDKNPSCFRKDMIECCQSYILVCVNVMCKSTAKVTQLSLNNPSGGDLLSVNEGVKENGEF
jgi:hypothetical protein